MQCHIKKIAVVLLAVMLFSIMAGYAYAGNTMYNNFNKPLYPNSYASLDVPDYKLDATAMCLQIDTSSVGGTYCVRAMGCQDEDTVVGAENCTLYNNQVVDHVVCSKGTYYSIDNVLYENNYVYCTIFAMQTGGYGSATGQWSPDTAKSFATPSAP